MILNDFANLIGIYKSNPFCDKSKHVVLPDTYNMCSTVQMYTEFTKLL